MDYRYVIVGGGMAADAAAKAVRKADAAGSISLISAEADEPYRRPPLSKGLWSGDDPAKIGLLTAKLGVDLTLGDAAVTLDLDGHCVVLASGKRVRYERLLLATGAEARSLPPLPVGGPVLAYRGLADFREARRRVGAGKRALVVGGGFIGSEVAAGLSRAGAEVHMVFPEEAISSLRFPQELSNAVTKDYLDRGVKIHAGASVDSADSDPDGVWVTLTDGAAEHFDLVVVGVGAEPNVSLAQAAGLAVADGVVVDDHLRATRAGGGDPESPEAHLGVYAAGDVAAFPWPRPFSRGRIEHEDNAVSMGAHAGREMVASYFASRVEQGYDADPTKPVEAAYVHFPFFYSDLFDNGYEAVGTLDSRLETVVDWRTPMSEGVVYYLLGDLVVGVLLWNTWGQVDAARDFILAAQPVARERLLGLLPR